MSDLDILKREWDKALSDFCSAEVSDKWWSHVVEKYSSEDRKYHNHDYLLRTFQFVKENIEKLKSPQAVAMAIFFQKLEYDPSSGDGDAACAERYKQFLQEAQIDHEEDERAKCTLELLEASKTNLTEEHMTVGGSGAEDRHYLLDALIAVLGAPPPEYELYTARVQAEYAHLSSAAYKQLRLKILQSLLLIPNVYATREFQERYEKQARENISKEIEKLKQSQH